MTVSLPTRERELKPPSSLGDPFAPSSLPTRERELKHSNINAEEDEERRSLHGSVN